LFEFCIPRWEGHFHGIVLVLLGLFVLGSHESDFIRRLGTRLLYYIAS